MKGAVVELLRNPDRPGLEWLIRINPATALMPFDVAVQSRDYVSTVLVGDWSKKAAFFDQSQCTCRLTTKFKLLGRRMVECN